MSRRDAASYDVGRYAQTPLKSMRGAFKTPTLRDIGLTAPYMRNGAYKTLMEVVEHYDRGGDDKENLDINMVPLCLTASEKADLVAFLESLTGVPPDDPRAGSSPLTDSRLLTMDSAFHIPQFV